MLIGAPIGMFGGGGVSWASWTGASDGANVDAYTSASLGATYPKLAAQISTGKILLGFTGWSGASSIYVVAGSVSGNSISYGSAALVATDGISTQASVCQMSTDTALIAYRKRTDSAAAHCNVITASGTTISVGSQSSEFTSGKGVSDTDIVPLTSTTALLVYVATWVYARVVTISGSSVSSFGTEVRVDNGIDANSLSAACVALSSTSALVVFGRSSGLTCVKVSVSGTTITVGNSSTEGTISLATGQAKNVRVAKMSSTSAVFHAVAASNVIGVITASGATPSFGASASLPSSYTYADIAFDTTVSGGIAIPTAGAAYGYSVAGTSVTTGSSVVVKTGSSFGPSVALMAETGKFIAEYSYSGGLVVGSAVLNP